MKRYIAIFIFLLSGCATTDTKVVVVEKNYDEVWDASIKAAAENFTITDTNKDKGVIKAEHNLDRGPETLKVFVSPPMNADVYTIEVVSSSVWKPQPNAYDWSDTVSSEIKRSLAISYGTIGLVSANYDPPIEFSDVTKGKGHGALKSAGTGAKTGAKPGLWVMQGTAEGCKGGGGGTALVCGALFVLGAGLSAAGAVVGTMVGGVAGAFKAESAGVVDEQMSQANSAFTGLKIQEALRGNFEQYAKDRGKPTFVIVDEGGPTSLDAEPHYQHYLAQKIDTIFEITVTSLGLQSIEKLDVDPQLAVFINARARLVRTKTNFVLENKSYVYESETHKFSEWSADNGHLLSDSLERGYQDIAKQIYPMVGANDPGQRVRLKEQDEAGLKELREIKAIHQVAPRFEFNGLDKEAVIDLERYRDQKAFDRAGQAQQDKKDSQQASMADPVLILKSDVLKVLVEEKGFRNIQNVPLALSSNDVDEIKSTIGPGIVLDFQTWSWGISCISRSAIQCQVLYTGRARFINLDDSRVIWLELCGLNPPSMDKSLDLTELEADEGALLKAELTQAAHVCAKELLDKFESR